MARTELNNLVEAAHDRGRRPATDLAYTFLSGDRSEDTLTMGELDERARALAATIQDRGLEGQPIVLLFPPGIDYIVGFWACLYAKAIAVPAYPPDPKQLDRTLPRLGGILRDSGAKAILTTATIRLLAESIFKRALGIKDVSWLTTRMAVAAGDWKPPRITRDDLAFLQYTSGSTGEPKGVMITHGNLIANTDMITAGMSVEKGLSAILWLPPYHDMGLIGGIIQPIISSVNILLMSPLDFISRPLRWLSVISRRRLQASGGPNFAYDLCARRITATQKATLDLSSWDLAFTGAEPIRSNSLRRFAEEFAECGFKAEAFYPCYGLAEATVYVTGAERRTPPTIRAFDREKIGRGEVRDARSLSSVEVVGVGRPGAGLDVRIVDPDTLEPCEADRVGEVWVSGPSVGAGYWKRDEETQHTFNARLAHSTDGPAFLRTGDLGFLKDGELFVVGRLKDLVIVNGTNYYPQDIETIADHAHPAIRSGSTAAIGVDRPTGEVLGLVAEVNTDRREDLEAAAIALRAEVTRGVGIAPTIIAFIPRRALPKTSSGKVRRRAAREGLLDGTLPTCAVFDDGQAPAPAASPEVPSLDAAGQQRLAILRLPPEERERAITAIVFDGLREVKPSAVDAANLDTPVTELGLDSINVVELLAEMEERSGVVLPMDRLARGATIRELVRAIADALVADTSPARAISSAVDPT
jgi:acyl-CoA synthetase (AMP-forming)/AMP-acid ligase II/acyl carrier protein